MGKSAVRGLVVFVLCALLPLTGWAAGLGRLSVLSALGQPLRAEIEVVSLQGEEVDSLSARLAPLEAYRAAKIEFADALLNVTASVQRRGNTLVVVLSSTQPLNDPFIDVLVELNWASGRLVREYTFLLDPPEYRGPAQAAMPALIEPARAEPLVLPPPAGAAPSVPLTTAPAAPTATTTPTAPTASGGTSASTMARAASATASAARSGAAAATAASEPVQSERTYRVQPGDTLGRVAQRYAIQGVSLEQMLIGLQRINPQAFEAQNINRLRSGQVLQLPDRATAAAVDAAEARRQVASQALEFQDFRGSLAQAVAATPARSETTRQASGRLSAPVEDKPAAPAPKSDQLRLSSSSDAERSEAKAARPASAGKGAAAAETANKDDEVARQKMARDLQERIALLERNLDDIQKLEALKRQAAQAAVSGNANANTGASPSGEPANAAAPPSAPAGALPVPVPAAPPAGESLSVEGLLDAVTQLLEDAMGEIAPTFDRLMDDPLTALTEDPAVAIAALVMLLLGLVLYRRRAVPPVEGSVPDAGLPAGSSADLGPLADVSMPSRDVDFPATTFTDQAVGNGEIGEIVEIVETAPPLAVTGVPASSDVRSGSRDALDFDLDFEAESPLSSPVDALREGGASPSAPVQDILPVASATQITSGAKVNYQDTVLDFDLSDDEPAASPTVVPTATVVPARLERPSMPFEGISLDLEPLATASAAAPATASVVDAPAADAPVVEAPASLSIVAASSADMASLQPLQEGQWQEVEIKLDLAKAYLEMTDRAGARELLQEVLSEGDAAQQQRARTLLDSLV